MSASNEKPTSKNSKNFARVVLPVPVATSFTYEIPSELRNSVAVGTRVEVPFGNRILSGIVVGLSASTDVQKLKAIRRISDTYMPPVLLKLTEWIASYYGCSLGEAAQSVLPPSFRKSKQKDRLRGRVALRGSRADDLETLLRRSPRQLELVKSLSSSGGSASVEEIVGPWGFTRLQIRNLVEKGVVDVSIGQRTSPLESIEDEVVRLNEDQDKVMATLATTVTEKQFSPLLLDGVTGSGKTELYIRAAKLALSEGGGCIVLVPEIGLLPQAVTRYRRVFGDQIAILHSRLTGAERFEIWRKVENGEYRLVLGPRSAIFSPVQNLRLIVVDEEQDDSYKQDDKPRYHARNVALMRGKFEKLTVLLGSATPSAESLYHAESGRYHHLSLPRRVSGTTLPEIQVVDMRDAQTDGAFFSTHLIDRLHHHIDVGNQCILFLNKRGHARYVQCNACGWVGRCQNCDITLTYHRVANQLKCHFCGYSQPAVTRCATCGSPRLYFSGVGTQRIELELSTLFPGVGILRMDADTTSGKEGHREVLEKFSTGDYPVLIGTQMVTKGHHFPRVNLVGVLQAEESLNYPDFRSSERTFQQLTQAAGRAGRGGRDGEVVVQTHVPDHRVFVYLKTHDYTGFMKEELALRRELDYPPFSRIVLASCSAPKQPTLERVVGRWTDEVRRIVLGKSVEVLGPVSPLVPRVKNRYREHVLIKGRLTDSVKSTVLASFGRVVETERGGRSVDLRWDVDPESFF